MRDTVVVSRWVDLVHHGREFNSVWIISSVPRVFDHASNFQGFAFLPGMELILILGVVSAKSSEFSVDSVNLRNWIAMKTSRSTRKR